MSNIKEVAKKAGVSIATVSNVLNDTQKVKDSTKARVLRAAAELNYAGLGQLEQQPPKADKTIGVIAEDLMVFNTPAILNAICQEARKNNYDVLLYSLGIVSAAGSLQFDELECVNLAKNGVNFLLEKNVMGIIYVGCQSREIKYVSSGYTTPFVYAYCYSNENNAPSVVYDDENAAYELIRHLIHNGHTNIGVITGPESNIHVHERMIGYQKAHFEAKILYNPDNLVHADWDDPKVGYHCAPQLLKNNVTAIFCMNDTIAGGVLDYALTHNIPVPQELSVVGFDNMDVASAFFPKLTTVALPLHEIGVEAVTQMDRLISHKGYQCDPHIITLKCHTVFRDSVGDRNAAPLKRAEN